MKYTTFLRRAEETIGEKVNQIVDEEPEVVKLEEASPEEVKGHLKEVPAEVDENESYYNCIPNVFHSR